MLRRILVWLAKRLGRWIISKAMRLGYEHLVGFMRGRIDTFMRRLSRARAKRRKSWLQFRIRNWKTALAYLIKNKKHVTDETFAYLDSGIHKALSKVPWNAICENYRQWCKG